MKKNSEKEIEQIKQDRTIKVKTLAIGITWVLSLVAVAITMWFYTCGQMSQYNQNVSNAAEQLVTQLSKTEAQK